jgi:hypothetical protein
MMDLGEIGWGVLTGLILLRIETTSRKFLSGRTTGRLHVVSYSSLLTIHELISKILIRVLFA